MPTACSYSLKSSYVEENWTLGSWTEPLTRHEYFRQFYALSLAHHPDKNPKNPDAASRFATISNAYHVLSNAGKRAKYDHDHDIHRAATVASGTRSGHRGSYVGSRPPSGLSKRRGPFRGPPPSFYAHGGYGATHHQPHPHPHQHPHSHQQQHTQEPHGAHEPTSSSAFGSSEHPHPSQFINHNTVPHFDAASHFRTQTHQDARRRERRLKAIEHAKMEAAARGIDVSDDDGNPTMRFFAVLGVLGLGLAVSMLGRNVLEGSRQSAAASSSTPSSARYVSKKEGSMGQQQRERQGHHDIEPATVKEERLQDHRLHA